jgi:hypothetical protein
LSADLTTAAAPAAPTPSRWGPFGHLAFTVIWTASLVSNVGTAMFDTASGWLITSLDANPITVSLVQVAVSLPLFLFTLPSGALADVIDSRRLLIAVEVAILAVSVVFAGLVCLNLATPSLLLATTFLLGVGGALTSPAWGATIPMLVPKQDLDSATAANGVAFNIGRAAPIEQVRSDQRVAAPERRQPNGIDTLRHPQTSCWSNTRSSMAFARRRRVRSARAR